LKNLHVGYNAKSAIDEVIALLQQDSVVSFFEAVSQIIKASGMDYGPLAEEATTNSASDPFYNPVIAKPMSRITVYRIATAKSLPTYATMRRLVIYGLGLSNEQCLWLESLRQQEEYIHHTTDPFVTVKVSAVKSKKPSSCLSPKVPEWVKPDK
jgi:hypothetical protein